MSYLNDIIKISKHFKVFPVYFIDEKNGKNRKVPGVKGWQQWATQDPDKIKSYWVKNPTAKVGAIAGEAGGFVVLDLDRKNGLDGVKFIKNIMKTHGKLPKTLGQKTASGGLHRLYKPETAAEYEAFKGRSDVLKGEEKRSGIDTRGNGGYIVVWPTPGYEFMGDLDKIAAPPKWLVELLEDENSAGHTKSSGSDMVVTPGQMRADLLKLNPQEYKSREAWMKVMMMCHSGSNGDDWGKDLFSTWSLRDEDQFNYDPVEYINRQWPSLHSKKESGLTYASIGFEVKKAILAEGYAEFEDDEEMEIVGDDPDIEVNEYNSSDIESERKLEDVWHRTSPAKGTPFLSKNLVNMINFLVQKKLPIELGRAENPLYNLVAFNELSGQTCYTKNPPWRPAGTKKDVYKDKQFEDTDQNEMDRFIISMYDVAFPEKVVSAGVDTAAQRHSFNPVVDYLKSLKFEGTSYLDSWLTRTTKTDDNLYTRAVARKTILSAVARALYPGCKVDTAMVFEGDQNVGKSGVLQILGKDWFGVPSIILGSADAEQNLQGLWWAEWAEFNGGRKAESDKMKAFMTNDKANFRGSYAKRSKKWPRRCVIAITLNPEGDNRWLNDTTGGRRFWPIEMGVKDPQQVDFKWLEEHVDQIYAEAYQIIKGTSRYDIDRCVPWTLSPKETKIARQVQADRITADPLEEAIKDLLYGADDNWSERDRVTPLQLAIQIHGEMTATKDQSIVKRIGVVLKNVLGWEQKMLRFDNVKGPRRGYKRPNDDQDPDWA